MYIIKQTVLTSVELTGIHKTDILIYSKLINGGTQPTILYLYPLNHIPSCKTPILLKNHIINQSSYASIYYNSQIVQACINAHTTSSSLPMHASEQGKVTGFGVHIIYIMSLCLHKL